MRRERGRPPVEQRRLGQSMVEFAFAVPAFVLLVLFIFEAGRMAGAWISVSSSAREGARVAAMPGRTNAEARQAVMNALLPVAGPGIVNTGSDNAGSDIDIRCRTYDAVTSTWSALAECTSRNGGQEVEVQVTYRFDPVPLIGGPLGLFNPSWTSLTFQAAARAYAE
jgi:Flp pilus assembly protein TadG